MEELTSGFAIKGKYKIVQKQGEGALGTAVYLGKDTENDKDIIIRVIPPALLSDDETTTRFIQGANLAQKLKHPNILEVLDAGDDNGVKYLVTNYEKGFFLNEYLEHRGSLDERESIKLVKSLAEALKYAWGELQIIHRNVCPDTILVAKGNIPLLTDFDLAKSLVADNKLTVEGLAIGDPLYMSPEQAKGRDVDYHSDIYCLGLVFYHLLAGKPLYSDKTRMEILRAQVSEKHPSIQSKNKDVTDACASVLDKMLGKEIIDRYQSWEDVINDLNAILNQEPPSTLQKVKTIEPTASRYKMQAIKMDASEVKAAVAAAAAEKSAVEPKQETNQSQRAVDAQKDSTPEAAAKSSPKTAIILIVLFIVFLAALGIGVLVQDKDKKDDDSDLNLVDTVTQDPELAKEAAKRKAAEEAKKKADELAAKKKAAEEAAAKQKMAKEAAEKKAAEEAAKKQAAKGPTPAEKEREAKHRKASMYNTKKIGEALMVYANIFEKRFPKENGAKGLDELRKNGIVQVSQLFVCPSSGKLAADPGKPITEETCDFVYVGGYSEVSDGKLPLLWTKPKTHKDYGIILYVNGDIKEFKGSNWLINTEKK